MTQKIRIPYNYEPRKYQLPLLQAVDSGVTRAVVVWHRRSGKDKTLINLTVQKMFERIGTYYYFFPTYNQGRKILWQGMDRDGFRFMDHIPQAVRKRTDHTQMLIETVNGSIFQIVGTDNIDSVVGTNPVGCVFSEYSLQDPKAWDFVRPILAENNGWAIFNFTPRGQNHGWDIYNLAKNDPNWFCQLLTVDDTGVINKEVLDQEKEEIVKQHGNDALFMQEYYCSFTVPVQGAYYGSLMTQAETDGRIGNVPYEPNLPVHTVWDLGVGDSTAIWFAQMHGQEIRLIDYYESSGEGLVHYVKILQDKGYVYGDHYAPFDIQVKELGTGKTRLEVARSLGINFKVVAQKPLEDGIEAVRNVLSRCWFDSTKCNRGVNILKSYHKEYDEKNKVYKSRPEHDWSSHGADAFRYLALGLKKTEEIRVENSYTPADSVIGI